MTQDILEVAEKITKVASAAKATFVNRDDAIDAFAPSILSAQHVLFLGKPGTAKSSLVSFFAKALGLPYSKSVLNPDILRDDLVGPIDIEAFENKKWDRAWAGLGNDAVLFFADEVGKASGQVLNMLLNAMEEREVIAGNTVKSIPLVTMFGATNENFEYESPALWDRFLVRTKVNPIDSNDRGGFFTMLTSQVTTPPSEQIDPTVLAQANKLCEQMCYSLSDDVKEAIWAVRSTLPTISSAEPSDRRWKRTLQLAAGQALACGSTQIEPHHLTVARFTLWNNTSPDSTEYEDTSKMIYNLVDKASRELAEATKLFGDLQTSLTKALTSQNGQRTTDLAVVNIRIDQLTKGIKSKQGVNWANLKANLAKLKTEVQDAF